MRTHVKRREAPIDYVVDWGRGWLRDARIVAAGWRVDRDEAGGVVVVPGEAGDGRSRVSIRGGVPGRSYTVTGSVALSDGRTATRALTLRIGSGR